jgi:hypothetical protein
MKLPIILRADDDLTWWLDPAKLQCSIESPDIEAGLYSAWDSQGQVLDVIPVEPVVRRRFLGIESVSVSPGRLIATGVFRPHELTTIIQTYLWEVFSTPPAKELDLSTALSLLYESQPSSDY